MSFGQISRHVVRAARDAWIVFVVVAVMFPVAAMVYMRTKPDVYTATALVTVGPKSENPVSASVVFLTAPRYAAYVTAPVVLRDLADTLGVNAHTLEDAVTVHMQQQTANLEIAVTLTDRVQATALASALADAVLVRAADDPILTAELISEAQVPVDPSGPPRQGIVAAAAVGGIVCAVLSVVVVGVLRRRRQQ